MRIETFSALLSGLILTACGGVGTAGPSNPSNPAILCTQPTPVDLAVGETRIIDVLNESSCITVAGGGAEREYLVALYSAAGLASSNGVSGPIGLRTGLTPSAAAASQSGAAAVDFGDPITIPALTPRPPSSADEFHRMLRVRERTLAQSPLAALNAAADRMAALRDVPVVGERDTFNVCATTSCTSFNQVTATVRTVGRHAVIYVDDTLPPFTDQLQLADLQQLTTLFDDYLFPLDTTAFGRESDINGDERIAILITDQVNSIITDCSDGRIVGFFFGGDLLPGFSGSNAREVFYTFAPVPSAGNCPAVSRATALRALPSVLIHELQHMISFNQRALVRPGNSEALWLDEGLSHYAEELGFRGIPDERCPNSGTCFSEFMSGNLLNAFEYLIDPPPTHLIAPESSGGSLAQRGAAWLFVTWLSDHFAADTLFGTQLTRSLVQTTAVGAQNVAAVTGVPFATLAGEWHLANYLENLDGFPQQGRLRYRSFDLRGTYGRNFPQIFDRPYPLVPSVTSGSITLTGTLAGGSAGHLRVVVPAGANGITLRANGATDVARINAALDPRFAVVRIR
ncbi:MAG: hypothetical protein U0974_11550 [Gemmatimonadales bacterium]|nr:hypothetical protein [Gemmatimonadales bacterium]MDZ4390349.1 hypothetical protein [Gemmatimonadales bacterium]